MTALENQIIAACRSKYPVACVRMLLRGGHPHDYYNRDIFTLCKLIKKLSRKPTNPRKRE